MSYLSRRVREDARWSGVRSAVERHKIAVYDFRTDQLIVGNQRVPRERVAEETVSWMGRAG